MDLDVINCQNQEELQKCFTIEYINSLKKECGCIPWTLRTHQEVFINVNFDLILLTYLQENVCNQKDKSCVESIKINKIHENKCLVQCSGLLVSGFTKSKGNDNFKDLFPVEFQMYNKYKYAFALRSAFKGRYHSQLCIFI